MPDITMCHGLSARYGQCPKAQNCFRYRAYPAPRQAFFTHAPFEWGGGVAACDLFWSVDHATSKLRNCDEQDDKQGSEQALEPSKAQEQVSVRSPAVPDRQKQKAKARPRNQKVPGESAATKPRRKPLRKGLSDDQPVKTELQSEKTPCNP